MTTAKSVYK